jgi:hypothetical protein
MGAATHRPSPRVWCKRGLFFSCVVFGTPAMCRSGTCSEKAPAWWTHALVCVRGCRERTYLAIHRGKLTDAEPVAIVSARGSGSGGRSAHVVTTTPSPSFTRA